MGVSLLGPLFGAFGMEAAKGAASAADAGLEMLFGERVSEALAEAQQAMRAYAGPLPPNHDLERALRCAQLTASLVLVRAHGMALEAEQAADGTERTGQAPPFLAAARGWLRDQLGLCPALRQVPNEALVSDMETALDEMLRSGSPVDAARSRSAAVAEACWAELRDGAGGEPPPEFRARFFGPAGWAAAFRALIQDALKKRPLVRDAYILSRLSALREDSAALRPALDALAGDTRAMREVLARVADDAAAARRNTEEILRLMAREKGVEPEVLRPIFEHLGHLNLSATEIRARAEEAVAGILDRARQAPAPSNDGADIAVTLGTARDKLGRLDTAGALATLSGKLAEEEAARRQRMVPLLREKAAIERLTYDHDAAKTTLRQLLDLALDEVWDWIELGDLHVTTGDLTAALAAFRAALAAARRVEPGGRDEAAVLDRTGDVQVAQGDLGAALARFRAGLAIRERLAAADPANAVWQRDLSVSHEKLGDVQVAQGDLGAALASFRAGLAISERLAAADPANAEWQRDLSVSHEKLGNVQVAQGDLGAALASFRAQHAIAERLAAADPVNAGWQRDMIVSCVKLAEVAPQEARAWLSRALDIARDLAASGRLAPVDRWMLEDLERRLAALGD
jgi:tetratricopeptide (TPR) repeat protein